MQGLRISLMLVGPLNGHPFRASVKQFSVLELCPSDIVVIVNMSADTYLPLLFQSAMAEDWAEAQKQEKALYSAPYLRAVGWDKAKANVHSPFTQLKL